MPKRTNVEQANAVRAKAVRHDRYYTPKSLVHIHLSKLASHDELVILEPCLGSGNYYNALPIYFPNCHRHFCEIDAGLDFFKYDGAHPDLIITNPPFSILDKFIEKMISLEPKVISLLLNMYAITPSRLRKFNAAGYYVTDYHLTRVDKWFGVSAIITLSREAETNSIGFDCTKHILEVA